MIDDDFLRLELGDKLRRLREERGRGLEQLARAVGLAPERLAAYEDNDAVPAIGDLIQLAAALEVSIGRFFQTAIPDKRVEVVRAQERFSLPPQSEAAMTLGYRYQALSHGLTEKLMAPFLVEIPPSEAAELPHSSHEGEEFLFVLAGQLEAEVGEERYRLGPGDAMYYDSRLEHSLRSAEGSTVRLIACVAQGRPSRGENPMGRAYPR